MFLRNLRFDDYMFLFREFQTLDLENAYVCFLHVYSYLGNIVKLNIDDVFMFLKLMWGISLF